MRIKDRLFLLPPCPPYDVEATESWLGEMAEKGWMLEKDNIFLGVAVFEKAEPARVRYRMEASTRRVGDFDDNGGAPDPEAEEMNADFGWEYVARRGQFHIYRSPAGSGPELHTDPRVQALAIKSLERREIHQLLSILLILGINQFALQLRGGSFLLSAAAAGLPLTLLAAFLALWMIAAPVREAVHLGRLKKRLAAGQPLRHDGDWRRGRTGYYARRLVDLLLFLTWLLVLLHLWTGKIEGRGKEALADYKGILPFADMRDFAAGDFNLSEPEVTWLDMPHSSVTDESNAFVRRYVDLAENARILRPDGTALDGGLYVTYFDARWEWLARALAGEFLRVDRRKTGRRWWEPLGCPDFGLDGAVAYRNDLHFPCVVLRQGKVVLRAMFYQTGPGEDMPLEQWAGILADSIR
jgi:hypothetical protein